MTSVVLYTPPNYSGVILNTPSKNGYKVSPGETIIADQRDESFLLALGFTPTAPIINEGTGTVTSIVFSAPLNGGTVETTGNVGLNIDSTLSVSVGGTLGVIALGGTIFTGTITATDLSTKTITVADGVITNFA